MVMKVLPSWDNLGAHGAMDAIVGANGARVCQAGHSRGECGAAGGGGRPQKVSRSGRQRCPDMACLWTTVDTMR
jgi:hypothetical protein